MNWRIALALSGGFASLGLALSALFFLRPPSSSEADALPSSIVVDTRELTAGVPHLVTLASPTGDIRLFLVRQPPGDLAALVARDPFSGCSVAWLADYDATQFGAAQRGAFKALCSGWAFDRSGAVLFGAAVRGLDRAPGTVSADGTSAHIDLSRFLLGLCRTDGQVGCSTATSPVFVQTLPLPQVRDWAKAR
jgi:hypothetical protein